MSTAVRERPIILSAEEVRAVLEGRQTQIRREVKPQPPELDSDFEWAISVDDDGRWQFVCEKEHPPGVDHPGGIERHLWRSLECPFGKSGERLWVKEAHAIFADPRFTQPHYFADGPLPTISEWHDAWPISIYHAIDMPRWASRITLEITDVRVERDEQWFWVIEFRRI